MKAKQQIYKNNIFVRFANVSNIYLIFYGYVQALRKEDPFITIKSCYENFITEFGIDDDSDHRQFQCGYNRIHKMIIELKQTKNK